jgi:hypothetical protein
VAGHAYQIRQKKFEVFWYTHHLFIVYYVLFAGHGLEMVLGDFPMAWCFVLIPCILYGFERISRAVRYASIPSQSQSPHTHTIPPWRRSQVMTGTPPPPQQH